MTKITEKQKRFADEYLKDLNGKQAAIRSGYSQKTAQIQASRLLTNAKVKAYLETKHKKIEEKTSVTVEWIIEQLKSVYAKSMQAVPVVDPRGFPTGEYKFEANAANRSLELLGKHIGMFTDRLQLGGKDGKPIELDIVDVKARLFEKLIKLTPKRNDIGSDS
jgi:phage terminase small subunit